MSVVLDEPIASKSQTRIASAIHIRSSRVKWDEHIISKLHLSAEGMKLGQSLSIALSSGEYLEHRGSARALNPLTVPSFMTEAIPAKVSFPNTSLSIPVGSTEETRKQEVMKKLAIAPLIS